MRAQIIMPGQMGLFLLSLSVRRRVSHPALLVARVSRIHTVDRYPFFLAVPVARFSGLRHARRAATRGSTGVSST